MTVTIYVPDLPDFSPVIRGVRNQPSVNLVAPMAGYWRIESPGRLVFSRKGLGLRVALWYSMLAGGYCGRMVEYSRDNLIIESEDQE